MFNTLSIKGFYGLPTITMGESNHGTAKLSGLNVIVGQNATGKTALLKLLYAVLKNIEEFSNNLLTNKPDIDEALSNKLFNTFFLFTYIISI